MHKYVCDLCSKRGIAGLCPTQELEGDPPGSYSHLAFKEKNLSGGPNRFYCG